MPEYPIPTLGEIPADFFEGAGKITSGELASVLNAISNETRVHHEPIVSASRSTPAPGQGPQPIVIGTLVGLNFDTVNDAAYRMFKIPDTYVGDASFHIHWTKSANGAENGRNVRWRLQYVVFNGHDEPATITPTEITADDVYEDDSTDATRIIYRTANLPAEGFIAGYYLGLRVDYVPASTTLQTSTPVLISVDSLMRLNLNK